MLDDAIWIPVITGLVELFKDVGFPKRFAPLLALTFGVIAGLFYTSPHDPAGGVLSGVVMGLASVGLYSGPKNLTNTGVKQ
ncbi:hypothetical protein [Melghirimyces algeriensis]|uniref:Holin n=1 Tax=Melghirimyces algeriensis TaxID=910412 RepID=A0A521BN43_9BACL|nr:hypothetical protein [Melghirimyces algeriensis]SMO48567.1 hypothetical protein SAMN06264849_102237 [Melghirimyces algeriensis]